MTQKKLYCTYLGFGVNISSVVKQESDHVQLSKVTCSVQWSVASLYTHTWHTFKYSTITKLRVSQPTLNIYRYDFW